MYLPSAFAMTEDDARSCITASGAAHLITHDPSVGFDATVLPLLLRGNSLVGHVARGNPIWQRTGRALAIFTPLDGYVSPSWYPSKQEHGKVVPTWNYITVHVHGTIHAHQESSWIREVVEHLTDVHEQRIGSNWKVSDAPAEFIEGQLKAIVGIEILIDRIEGKSKLSQNRGSQDVDGVIASAPPVLADAVRTATGR